ncbi:MAG: hypothetical protein GC151_10575 [Betaproteobacteria bacterium]|nr:hypothetical protein [Betaproteobacteria bacterium]
MTPASLVRRYMAACNSADRTTLEACFAEDVIAYFIDMPPVRGRRELAHFWCRVHEKTGALWTCDRVMADADAVIVEWTEMWTPRGADARVLSRGVDLFETRDGLIHEIRQYHRPGALPWSQAFELEGFPYEARGYPLAGSFDEKVATAGKNAGS